MSPRSSVVALLAACLSVAAPCAAQTREGARLWVAHGLDEDTARAVRRALEQAGASLMGAESLESHDAASVEEGRRAEARVTELVELARDQFVGMDLRRARTLLDTALSHLLSLPHRAPTPCEVADIQFRTYLLERFGGAGDARLRSVLALCPRYEPEASLLSPAVSRDLSGLRAARAGEARSLRVAVAPEDARVEVDGRSVEAGDVPVAGAGPHLVVVTRPGFRRWARLVDAAASTTSVRAELERASGPELVHDAATMVAAGAVAVPVDACVVARALDLQGAVLARAAGDAVQLVAVSARHCEVDRTARGQRESWEPSPFAALAASFDGRPARPVGLGFTAPARVALGESFTLQVDLDDPLGWVRRLESSCDDQRRSLEVAPGARALAPAFDAPAAEADLRCQLRALSAGGRVLARAPHDGSDWIVEVRPGGGGVDAWVWVLIGVALAGAGVTVGLLAYEPDQRLVFPDAL